MSRVMGFPELATVQVAGLSRCFLATLPSHMNPSRRKTGITLSADLAGPGWPLGVPVFN